MEKKKKVWLIILIIAGASLVFMITAVALIVHFINKAKENHSSDISSDIDYHYEEQYDIDDFSSLNDAVDAINDLDLNTDVSVDVPDTDETGLDESAKEEIREEPSGDVMKYGFVDVTKDGNIAHVVPNGGLNSKTDIFGNGKDLGGFLDYVDSTVLEKGRTINRDFFYQMYAIMQVDMELNSNLHDAEGNMVMALAMANNFYNLDVKINSCDIDVNNAADYRYNVTEYGKDDVWLVNYGKRTVYFNDGKTEYSSTMFNDEYLAAWLMAIEDYYGVDYAFQQ